MLFLFHLKAVTQTIQNDDLPPFAEPGKCYAQAISHNYFKPIDTLILVYTGDKLIQTGVEFVEILIEPNMRKWVRDTIERLWFQVDIPAIYKGYYIVTDTNRLKSFKKISVTQKKLISEGGRTSWVETLCRKYIKPKLIRKLQRKLVKSGYLNKSNISGIIDENTKYALYKFQIENGFPPATLNIMALKHLGLHFKNRL